ncbi:MAG: exo-alpha-sialidase, partial [Phycisphaerales bacterium]
LQSSSAARASAACLSRSCRPRSSAPSAACPSRAGAPAAAGRSAPAAGAGEPLILGDGSPNPAYPGLHAWYRADAGVNGETDTPTDGSVVTSWSDHSTNGRHLTRVSSNLAERPRFDLDLANGMPAVDFDGDDFLWSANASSEFGVLSSPHTVIVVCRPTSADGGYIFDSSSSSGRTALITGEIATPGRWVLYSGAGTTIPGSTVNAGGVSLVSATVEAGSQALFVNGMPDATGTNPATSMSGIILGSRFNLDNRLTGSISEVLVYGEVLSEADRLAIEGHLESKYEIDVPPPPLPSADVFVGGEDGYPVYRIPSIVQLASGRLLAFAEGRESGADNGANDIVMKASDDLGKTWGPLVLVDDQPGFSLNNPCVVEVREGPHAGRVVTMYQSYPTGCGEGCVVPGYDAPNICRTFTTFSEDGGATWSTPADVTAQVKRPTIVTSVASGPGVGIQLRRGKHAGRLVMPFNQGPFGVWKVYAAWSDDGGVSWQYGEVAADGSPGVGNEVQMVERADGSILLNARHFGGAAVRRRAISTDGGATWSPLENGVLPDPSCNAGLIALTDPIDGFEASRIVFSGPDSTTGRVNGHAWLSTDGGATWPTKIQVHPGGFAYSLPVPIDCDRFGVFYEKDGYSTITLALVDFETMTGGDTYADEGSCAEAPCPADLDADGGVGGADLATLLGLWGKAGGGSAADFDQDGVVGGADLAVMLGAWGACGG